MMNKVFHKILFILTILILTSVLIQTETKFIELKPLKGVSTPAKKPEFTFESYRTNTFQTDVDHYLKDHFGFREWLIPFYNQYAWDFYNKVENKGIYISKDNWLFFFEHVQDYYESLTFKYVKSGEEMATILENDARKVYLLQEILKDYGTTLFVCIAPSKNELYPEFLPENDKYFSQGGIHADDFYVKRFTELGVNFLDLNTLYKEIKDTVDYPLFYKAASHYSIIAATYTVDTLIKYMESVSELNIQNIEFEEPYIDKPIAIDRDIENLLNLMRPIEKTDYYYVHTTTIPDSTAVTPRWLSIGDSFYWNIRNEETVDEVFNESPFWYYANTIHYDKHNKWKTKDVDLIDELVFSDFVMLIWCPINIYELERNNIINNSLLSLCYDEKYLEKNRQNIITEIKNSPEWYQSIERQAEKENKNIEETLLNNANYLLRDPGSNRLTEIKGYDVPEVRNSRLKTIKKYFENYSKEEIVVIKKIYRNLINDPKSVSAIKEKAERRNVSFEEAALMDAVYIYNQKYKGE